MTELDVLAYLDVIAFAVGSGVRLVKEPSGSWAAYYDKLNNGEYAVLDTGPGDR